MNVIRATQQFEEWLSHHTVIVKRDLRLKHTNMKAAVFPFLRATYYRWAQVWPQVCPHLAKSPRVLAVGDLHVENFGTWRDGEGRLIWGVNDFDEAHPMGYANDLVRLAVSAHLASQLGHLPVTQNDICDSVLDGYREGLREEGSPFVLEEKNGWLRQAAFSELRDPVHFWARMNALPTVTEEVPLSAIEAIEHLMPARGLDYRLAHRVAGLGSLGHARYVALADWHGGRIAREAKALVASASYWAQGGEGPPDILYQMIMNNAVRCLDPFVELRGRWIVRRLSPHCCRIELASLKAAGEENRLLHAMGYETANIHLGTKGARRIVLRHLGKQKAKWLHEATLKIAKVVEEDWATWKKHGYQ